MNTHWTASTNNSNAVAMRIITTDAGWRATELMSHPLLPKSAFGQPALGTALLVDQQRTVEVCVVASAAAAELLELRLLHQGSSTGTSRAGARRHAGTRRRACRAMDSPVRWQRSDLVERPQRVAKEHALLSALVGAQPAKGR